MWNKNIDEAPRDRRVWLASVCGKVIPTYWVDSRKNWAGFQNTPPVAWTEYVVPKHPDLIDGAFE